MKTEGYILLFVVFILVISILRSLPPLRRAGLEGALYLLLLLVAGTIVSAIVLWEYFIKADFFEMPPIRYTRKFIQWLRRRHSEDVRLRTTNLALFHIPAPGGDDRNRDFELELIIRKRRWNEAEQYIREKLAFHHSDLSQAQNVTNFLVYVHYFRVLMDLRQEHLGTDDKEWASDIERYVSRTGLTDQD